MRRALLRSGFLIFRLKAGVIYLCPRCGSKRWFVAAWDIPSDTRDELLRCPVCE